MFAKANNGKFILRIEDTDKTREVPGSDKDIMSILKWAGLQWDEGPGSAFDLNQDQTMGPYGPYYQSQRLDIYRKFAETLVESENAYYWFWTPERLKQLRASQSKDKGKSTMYDRFWLGLSKEEVQEKIDAGIPYTIRMLIPEGQTTF